MIWAEPKNKEPDNIHDEYNIMVFKYAELLREVLILEKDNYYLRKENNKLRYYKEKYLNERITTYSTLPEVWEERSTKKISGSIRIK